MPKLKDMQIGVPFAVGFYAEIAIRLNETHFTFLADNEISEEYRNEYFTSTIRDWFEDTKTVGCTRETCPDILNGHSPRCPYYRG